MTGVPSEDFLCVSEPDEDECLSSRLDGDEAAHQQVSRGAGVECCRSVAAKAWGQCSSSDWDVRIKTGTLECWSSLCCCCNTLDQTYVFVGLLNSTTILRVKSRAEGVAMRGQGGPAAPAHRGVFMGLSLPWQGESLHWTFVLSHEHPSLAKWGEAFW